jgi:hypothetical protein
MIVFILLAAASAWLVTRRAPQHRPIALALTICAGLDAVRLLPLPARIDMALCLGTPVASRWAYVNALRYGNGREWQVALIAWLLCVPLLWLAPPAHWHLILPCAYLGMPILGGVAGALSATAIGYRWGMTQRVALILLAGDALAVASLCAREWISDQAGVVLGLVTVYQVAWHWRWTRAQGD